MEYREYELCKLRPASEIHHIIYRSHCKALIKSDINLIPLCQICHAKVHRGKESKKKGTGIEDFYCDCWSLSHKVLEKLEKEFNYQNRGIYESDFYNKRIDSKSTIIEIGFLNKLPLYTVNVFNNPFKAV